MEDVEVIARLLDLGATGLFFVLYWRERQLSQRIREAHLRDLRRIAGLPEDDEGETVPAIAPPHEETPA